MAILAIVLRYCVSAGHYRLSHSALLAQSCVLAENELLGLNYACMWDFGVVSSWDHPPAVFIATA